MEKTQKKHRFLEEFEGRNDHTNTLQRTLLERKAQISRKMDLAREISSNRLQSEANTGDHTFQWSCTGKPLSPDPPLSTESTFHFIFF